MCAGEKDSSNLVELRPAPNLAPGNIEPWVLGTSRNCRKTHGTLVLCRFPWLVLIGFQPFAGANNGPALKRNRQRSDLIALPTGKPKWPGGAALE